MFANLMRMRIGAMIAGVILVIWIVASGGFPGLQKKGVIQIDFSAYPEEWSGLEVEIDGQVVGTLQKLGNACRTGFKVREGRHEVRVLHPEMESMSKTIDVEASSIPVFLILDFRDAVGDDGQVETVLGFL